MVWYAMLTEAARAYRQLHHPFPRTCLGRLLAPRDRTDRTDRPEGVHNGVGLSIHGSSQPNKLQITLASAPSIRHHLILIAGASSSSVEVMLNSDVRTMQCPTSFKKELEQKKQDAV